MHDAIAIILARGGSKRVPRKNMRRFHGKPMVRWPIEHAIASGLFKEILISTDDQEIANMAKQSGASFHTLRPATLSGDHATTVDVLRYELESYSKREGCLPKLCCCLYGTSASVTTQLLGDALQALIQTNAHLAMAVIRYRHPIERALCFDADGLVYYRQPAFIPTRTQDIPPSYHDAGLFYFFDVRAFMASNDSSFFPLKKTAIEVSGNAVVDIDTEEDWDIAELLAGKNMLGMEP